MSISCKKYQSGITLITSLMMLMAVTIIGVTAVKLSIIDLLVASNYQQQLAVYQEAETVVRREASLYRLYDWIVTGKHPAGVTRDTLTSKVEVVDLGREYPCQGHSNLANSLGPSTPICKLFMLSVDTNMKGSGAQVNHYKGVGKQFPSQSDGSYY